MELTEDQREFKELAVKFANSELNDKAREREKNCEFNADGWKKCAEFGIQGLSMPEQYGGLGRDILTCIAAMEGLGYACKDSGLLFALNTHMWTCEAPILKFGTDAQKEKFLPRLITGSFKGGHAITEPGSGSDVFNMKCKAVKKGSAYVLNGTKMFITNAPIADILLVFAITDPHKGFAGISAFIVEKGFPGFSVGKPLEMMGLKPARSERSFSVTAKYLRKTGLAKRAPARPFSIRKWSGREVVCLPRNLGPWRKRWKNVSFMRTFGSSLVSRSESTSLYPINWPI